MASVSRTDVDYDLSTLTTYSFTCTIGTDGGSDSLYFHIGGRSVANATDISSVTVDSTSASKVDSVSATEGSNITCVNGIFAISRNSLPTPSNTTVSVSVTFNAEMVRAVIDTYVSGDASITKTASATDFVDAGDTSPATLTLDLNTVTGGIVIGNGQTGDPSQSFSWTGLTEQDDFAYGNSTFSTAYANNVTGETPRSVSVDVTQRWAPVGVAASFPAAASGAVGDGLVSGSKLERVKLAA